MTPAIRLARPSDLRHLAAIEDAGGVLFEEYFGRSVAVLSTPAPSGGDRDLAGTLLVAQVEGELVGFAHLTTPDDQAHLEQVSVLPACTRRGIGTALVRATLEEARWAGFDRLSLCTFRDVVFNAPFYATLGFTEVTALEPFQRRLRATETALGLDDLGARVVMSASTRGR